MIRFLSTWYLVMLAFTVMARRPVFEEIGVDQGLSQGMIFDIVQTRDGFLWFATKDGLNRYDGYNFKVFTNDPFAAYSLAENTVTSLFEDSKGRLWVGLQNKGVDVYDPVTGRFHHFPLDFSDSGTQWDRYVEDIIETPADGAVWVLMSGNGLIRFALPEDWKDRLPGSPNLGLVFSPEQVPLAATAESTPFSKPEIFKELAIRPNGELLVFSEQMIYVVDPRTLAAHPFESFRSEKILIRSALTTRQGKEIFWLARIMDKSDHSGADLVRLHDGQAEIFTIPEKLQALWKRLFPGKNGDVWLVIGRNLWNLAPGEEPDFSKPDYVFDAVPTTWMVHRNGNAWAGTIGYGLRKINHLQGLFNAGADDWSLSGLWSNHGLYYAKWVNSIRSYDPLSGRLSDHSAFPDAPAIQISLAFEPSGEVWVLAASEDKIPRQMLLQYAPGGIGTARRIFEFDAQLNPQDPMFRARDGRLWIATHGVRLVRFDPATERFDYFDAGHLFGPKANVVRSVAIVEDEAGTIWVGTNQGLIRCAPSANGFDFQLIQANPDKPNGLNINSIACIWPDVNGLLWLGTKGGGINVMDTRTGHCRHITTENGLLNNVVYGILPGNLPPGLGREFWCSTNRGLARIQVKKNDPSDFTVTTYTAELGLQDNEFNTQGYFKSDNGELLFGGINGLNRFFPDQLPQDNMLPSVYIVGIEINHEKAGADLLGGLPERLTFLKLNQDQNNLSFEFAALDYTDPSKNRYRYRLVGLDNDWVETGNHRFAHFSHLPPGTYEFRVQGNNGESDWADAPHAITLVVLPPWWRSNLAYLCYFLLLGYAGWWTYQLQIRRVKEREQLAFEQRETERIRASEQMKTNFFNSVTHEFRTPLTLILEPLRQLLKNPDDPGRLRKIQLAEKNSQQLLQLVNQLLDTAKLQSGSMKLHLRRADFHQTVQEVFGHFLPLAEKKGVQLTFSGQERGLSAFYFDPGKVEIVLNNLVSNALKFTPEGGTVLIKLNREPHPDIFPANSSSLPRVAVQVSDTGIGIPTEELPRVFERFYQVEVPQERANQGTGIGLSLSKELAELMGGGITVESEPGKGSTFSFWLPVVEQAGLSIQGVDGTPANAYTETGGNRHSHPGFGDERPMVLLVEDNPELREFIKLSLGENWDVVEASDGLDGFKKAIEWVPEIVISDVMMPSKDGYSLCRELKAHELTAHVPVILLTAKSAMESKLQGLHSGADDYLTKPFYAEELLARMENLVDMRRKLRDYYGGKPVSKALETREERPSPDQAFLKRFIQLLEDHLTEEQLGVEDFSKKMFLSRSQLHRKLKAISGRNATEFIRDYRLEKAYDLLRQGGLTVAEVVLQVGFGNEKYFSTVFKQKYGLPPSQVFKK